VNAATIRKIQIDDRVVIGGGCSIVAFMIARLAILKHSSRLLLTGRPSASYVHTILAARDGWQSAGNDRPFEESCSSTGVFLLSAHAGDWCAGWFSTDGVRPYGRTVWAAAD
jgi:hypothetical protein